MPTEKEKSLMKKSSELDKYINEMKKIDFSAHGILTGLKHCYVENTKEFMGIFDVTSKSSTWDPQNLLAQANHCYRSAFNFLSTVYVIRDLKKYQSAKLKAVIQKSLSAHIAWRESVPIKILIELRNKMTHRSFIENFQYSVFEQLTDVSGGSKVKKKLLIPVSDLKPKGLGFSDLRPWIDPSFKIVLSEQMVKENESLEIVNFYKKIGIYEEKIRFSNTNKYFLTAEFFRNENETVWRRFASNFLLIPLDVFALASSSLDGTKKMFDKLLLSFAQVYQEDIQEHEKICHEARKIQDYLKSNGIISFLEYQCLYTWCTAK